MHCADVIDVIDTLSHTYKSDEMNENSEHYITIYGIERVGFPLLSTEYEFKNRE